MRAQVFITQDDPAKDFSKAHQFGTVRILSPTNVGSDYSRLFELIHETLKEAFDPERDYLIPIGSPILVGLTFVALFDLFDSVNVLMWDRLSKSYEVKKITV